MKILNKIFKFTATFFLVITVFLFVGVFYISKTVNDNYKITKGDTLKLNSVLPISSHYEGAMPSQKGNDKIGDTYEANIKLFGVIPVKNVNVQIVDELYVAVLGEPFGMKIYTDGVLVIELSDVDTKDGEKNPAKEAGIKVGDYIETVNGEKITCNEDLSALVLDSNGRELEFNIIRGKKKISIDVKPQISLESGSYRIGLWVRDSSAGIGTLTFYSPSNNVVCGLGHGICDSDTGEILQIYSGEMVKADIVSITKGDFGSPGELKGSFKFDSIADISLNSELGVYGKLNADTKFETYTEVALKQEVVDGEAQILCTVSGDTPKLYNCKIKRRNSNYLSKTQNFTVTVTDKELLQKTGGIVQGMSGSPIIQNGKLIGAVTHVLVDDPTRGYAIFAENMLETAQSVAEEKLKEVS